MALNIRISQYQAAAGRSSVSALKASRRPVRRRLGNASGKSERPAPLPFFSDSGDGACEPDTSKAPRIAETSLRIFGVSYKSRKWPVYR